MEEIETKGRKQMINIIISIIISIPLTLWFVSWLTWMFHYIKTGEEL